MVASSYPRRTRKSCSICVLSLPSSFFLSQLSTLDLSHLDLQTFSFTVVHPLSVQLFTKCSSRNSFIFKTIHFDGGGCTPPPRGKNELHNHEPQLHHLNSSSYIKK